MEVNTDAKVNFHFYRHVKAIKPAKQNKKDRRKLCLKQNVYSFFTRNDLDGLLSRERL